MAIVAFVMRIRVWLTYRHTNKIKTVNHLNSQDVARQALDKVGLEHIQVKKCGFFRALVFGNSYSLSKKTIFLRKNIYNKDSLTAVGLALQKVGVARLCEGDSKLARTRNRMQVIVLFGPFLFIPIVLLGVVIDLLVLNTGGGLSVGSIIVGFIFLGFAFVETLLNIPVERKANKMALETIDEAGICTKEERDAIEAVLKTYIVAYVCEFILTVLRIIQFILEIVMRAQISSKNN